MFDDIKYRIRDMYKELRINLDERNPVYVIPTAIFLFIVFFVIVLLMLSLGKQGYNIAFPSSTPTPTSTSTPTSTPTLTSTPTSTPTPTSTATPTPTSTPTATPTSTPTDTPTPFKGIVRYEYVAVYKESKGNVAAKSPENNEPIFLQKGLEVHLCGEPVNNRYLVARDHCHSTEPLGWVTESNLDIQN